MAEISIEAVGEAGMEIMRRAAIDIPDYYRNGIRALLENEDNELSRFVLQSMIENWEAAEADRRAMCGDTGLPRYYVKIGNEARVLRENSRSRDVAKDAAG